MADLQDMLDRVAAARSMTLSATSNPTENECIDWINDGILWVTSLLARFGIGEEKISGLIEEEAVVGANGFAPLPASSITVLATKVGTLSTALYVVSTLRTTVEVLKAHLNSNLADASAPKHAYGAKTTDAKLIYAPTSLDSVVYTKVTVPTALTTPASDDLPFDGDLRVPVQAYAIWKMWEQGERNAQFANSSKEEFFYFMQALTGLKRQEIERVVSTPM